MNQIARLTLVLLVFSVGCEGEGGDVKPTAPPTMEPLEVLDLPPARLKGDLSLEEALAKRRSTRTFSDRPLSQEDLAQLLWAAQGQTSADGKRSAPSAGALYPLEVYAITSSAVCHYLPAKHKLELLSRSDLRPALSKAAFGQASVAEAPCVFAISAVEARTSSKYGARGSLYVKLEAGHAAQNVLLQATALGLGSVPVGGFDPDDVARLIGCPAPERVLYLLAVGHRGTQSEAAPEGSTPSPGQ